jgi:predicted Na+-dependent transporter
MTVTFAEVGSSVLLFFLVFGMSATVDMKHMRKQVRNRNALLIGVSLQFIVLPFLGFCVVKILNMSAPMGITLLVVTSSPGGSYSNWWCSMFNADLALSVTMTAISTLLSVIMLPVNLIIYATTSYSSAVVKSLDWAALFHSLITVIGAIACGLLCSATCKSHKFNLMANKLGNVAGIGLVTYSIVLSSSDQSVNIWDESLLFYVGVALPCVLGLTIATCMATYFRLEKPERVSVAVECCYQNTGIATSVAITMFAGDDLATAVGVPLFYGICEAVLLAIFCLGAWKIGWTKAPKDENVCVIIAKSYEVEEYVMEDPNAIEIVLGSSYKDGMPSDLIFATTEEGYQIDEDSLDSLRSRDTDSAGGSAGHNASLDDSETVNDSSTIATDDVERDHVELSPTGQAETPSPVRQSKREKRKLRRKGSHYSSIGADSPLTPDKGTVDISRDGLVAPPLENHEDITVSSSSSGNRIENAVASIRSRAGKGKRYTKAVAEGSVAETLDENDEEEEQVHNFPSLSPAVSTEDHPIRVAGDHAPIPAEDRRID